MSKIPNTNEISSYMHCSECIKELPIDQSPRDYQRVQVGYTKLGIQVWCVRHNCNIVHIDFEGKSPFHANTTRSNDHEINTDFDDLITDDDPRRLQ